MRERRSKEAVARGAHRIDGTEATEMAGTYGDPAKAIENFPGMGRVLLSQGSLFVRGAAPNESAVFVDDYEIPDLYHFTGSLLKAYDANVTYTAYEIGAGIGYKFVTTRKYQTELVLKGLFIPYLEYLKDNTFNESTYAYGAELSLDNYLRATENLSFFLGLLLRQIQSATINFPEPYRSEKLSFVGYGINLGLSYAF